MLVIIHFHKGYHKTTLPDCLLTGVALHVLSAETLIKTSFSGLETCFTDDVVALE